MFQEIEVFMKWSSFQEVDVVIELRESLKKLR